MMLSNAKIGTKLIAGFVAVLIPLVLVAVIGIRGMRVTHSNLVEVLTDDNVKVSLANDMIYQINLIARAVRNVVLTTDDKMRLAEQQRIEEARDKFKQADEKLSGMVKSDRGKAIMAAISESQEMVKPITNKVLDLGLANKAVEATEVLMKELREPQRKLIENIDEMIEYQNEVLKGTGEQAEKSYSTDWTLMVSVSGLALAMGILAAFFISRDIKKSLTRISDGLAEGAEQVASASGQVSSASQSLAEGSTEQAASLEETSASLEEMSSMTKQNADNARQADTLMGESRQVIDTANTSMSKLTGSMEEITRASEETSKIIKTIDEIAFQTNLLALNAAVEAARAGEAGAGFAVVADEVRNLALRAADAAKNTAALIEGTVKKVKEGSNLVTGTNDAFKQVAASSAKVAGLVGEIAAASREQAQGIEEVNKAVTEMDKVTQQNAANAEESASASEEMNAQAEQMKTYVESLVALVGGKNGHNGNGFHSRGEIYHHGQTKALVTHLPAKRRKMTLPKPHEIDPGQVIPMDEEDFRNF